MADKIAAAAAEEGDPLPKGLQDKPQLDIFETFYYESFLELNTDRRYSSGSEGPIPRAAIEDLCDREGITDLDDRDDLFFLMRKMDSFYLDYIKKKREREREAAKEQRNLGRRK